MGEPTFPQDQAEAERRRQAQASERDASGKEEPGIGEHEAGGSGLPG